tara:strand:+ start:668 stop:838 length:171 start_codon:yes stop_codon:yes gene_type:complete
LFVYFNIGNPLLLAERESFYGSEASEPLIEGRHYVVDADSDCCFHRQKSIGLSDDL